MIYCAEIPAFPEEVGQYIELPDTAELLLMPMFNNISAEDLRKHGTDFHRELLDKAPLRNRTKYVTVKSFIQFLYPQIGACDIKVDPKYQNEWHMDYDLTGKEYFWHILTNECTSRTEFNINPFTLMCEATDVRGYLNEDAEKLGLKGRKIRPNKFCTFTNHVHRPAPSLKPEFRYFFRVQETSFKAPLPYEEARMFTRDEFKGIMVHKNGVNIPNLDHQEEGIMIFYPWNEVQK